MTSAQRSMLFNLIGRLTLRLVELESIGVTVVPFSPGKFISFSLPIILFVSSFLVPYPEKIHKILS